jgi:hypothetical protein
VKGHCLAPLPMPTSICGTQQWLWLSAPDAFPVSRQQFLTWFQISVKNGFCVFKKKKPVV